MSFTLSGLSLYAIDPGTTESALVTIAASGVVGGRIYPNLELLAWLRNYGSGHVVVEEVESFGMPVGREVFQTVLWSGRFIEAWDARGLSWSLLPRRAVKLELCGSARAKDANIRQALIDRYGGSQAAKKGGPLAGIKSHLWSALALAVTYQAQAAQAARRTEPC